MSVATPALAQAGAADQAIAQAEKAVDDAETALRAARAALADARAARDAARREPPAAAPMAQDGDRVRIERVAGLEPLQPSGGDPSKGLPPSQRPEECGNFAKGSREIVKTPATINRFQNCIGFDSWKDFEPKELAAQLAASSDGTVDVTPTLTAYLRTPVRRSGVDGVRNDYVRFTGGISAKLEDGADEATLADFSKPGLTKGVAGTFGVEFGRGAWRALADDEKLVRAQLDKARIACEKQYAHDVPRSEVPPEVRCAGIGLLDYMWDEEQRATYYKSLIKPLWGYDKKPMTYFGVVGWYSRPEYKFFPFSDPAGTGIATLTTLPAGFPGGDAATKISREQFSATAYVGQVFFEGRASIAAGLGYGRKAEWLDEEEEVCAPLPSGTSPYLACDTIHTAPPYYSQGWIVSGRVAMDLGRVMMFPPMSLEAKVNYAFDTGRLGLEVPWRLFVDDDGDTTGGVKLVCKTPGETPNGHRLKGSCKTLVFVGSKFSLTGKP